MPPASAALFLPVPLAFHQAFLAGKVNRLGWALGADLVGESLRLGKSVVHVYVADLARRHKVSGQAIREALRALRPEWADFPDPGERQRTPWPITLTGLDSKALCKARAKLQAPSTLQTSAKPAPGEEGATPPAQSDPGAAALQSPPSEQGENRREDTNTKPSGGSNTGKGLVAAFRAKNGGKWPTGWRLSRGTHSATPVPDPLGFEPPPPWAADRRRPSREEVYQALRKRGAA